MTISIDDVDREFYETTKQALAIKGMKPMEFAMQHRRLSKIELAKLLGNGASAWGLTMLLFEEAQDTARIRELAENLLFRKILAEYANGWYDDEKISTTVKIGRWYSNIANFAPAYENAAFSIVRSFASDPPANGWLPESEDDEQLQRLFDKYWKQGV